MFVFMFSDLSGRLAYVLFLVEWLPHSFAEALGTAHRARRSPWRPAHATRSLQRQAFCLPASFCTFEGTRIPLPAHLQFRCKNASSLLPEAGTAIALIGVEQPEPGNLPVTLECTECLYDIVGNFTRAPNLSRAAYPPHTAKRMIRA